MKYLVFIAFLFALSVHSQIKNDFTDEVAAITQKYDRDWDPSRETIVFTGSSSIRLWSNIQEFFPEHQIVNTGFGGSQAFELLEFIDPLVLRFHPKKVFIYEGDNDIAEKKKIKSILDSFEGIISKIKGQNASTQIILISPKPSISRWHLKGKYKRLNRRLRKLCEKDEALQFANVWDIMLEKRKLKTDLFIEDGLHMNAEGYKLWYSVIKKFMD